MAKQIARVLNQSGAWLPLGHKALPPRVPTLFSRPRYWPAEQDANPDKPMTRLVKDVLRAGSWKVGIDAAGKPIMWDVSANLLRQIAQQVQLAQHRGVAMNLTKSHGNLATGIVPTDDLISPLDEVIADGDVLWISTYVTPEQAANLTNPACKVSPFVMANWIDGLGNTYPEMLLHVAVTDQPVLPGQGPFVAMANSQGANAMDLATLLPLINELLSACGGPQLPETTDETNIVGYLQMAISMVTGSPAEEEPEEEIPAIEGVDEGGGVAPAVAMNNAVKAPAWAQGLITQVKALSNTVSQLQQGSQAQAEAAYIAKLTSLVTTGKITPAQKIALEANGPALGYALSNLQVFDLNPTVQPGGKSAKALANGNAPAVDGDKKKMTAEEHAESLKKRGLKPVTLH